MVVQGTVTSSNTVEAGTKIELVWDRKVYFILGVLFSRNANPFLCLFASSRKLDKATLSFELLNVSWTLRSYQVHFTIPECLKLNWTLKFYVSILEVK